MATQSIIKPAILKIAKQYLSQCKTAGIIIDQAILFGSHAKGNPKPWSDIDLCIVSPKFGINRYDERLYLLKLRSASTIDIEPHPYNQKDLDFKFDSLANEIRSTGVLINPKD